MEKIRFTVECERKHIHSERIGNQKKDRTKIAEKEERIAYTQTHSSEELKIRGALSQFRFVWLFFIPNRTGFGDIFSTLAA